MSKAYPSNLTQPIRIAQRLDSSPKSGGRPREVDMWEILNAIFYILCEDAVGGLCQETFPWQTVYTYFRNWRKDGTWVRIHDSLRQVRVEQGDNRVHRKPSSTVKALRVQQC